MSEQSSAANDSFSALAESLEQAIQDVKKKRAAHQKATAEEADASSDYGDAIRAAQEARSKHDAHINEAMAGFAQIHQ